MDAQLFCCVDVLRGEERQYTVGIQTPAAGKGEGIARGGVVSTQTTAQRRGSRSVRDWQIVTDMRRQFIGLSSRWTTPSVRARTTSFFTDRAETFYSCHVETSLSRSVCTLQLVVRPDVRIPTLNSRLYNRLDVVQPDPRHVLNIHTIKIE